MSSNKIVLISIDGESFEIDEKVARKLLTISDMIDDDCVDAPIPLQNSMCTGDILKLVIEYGKNICDQDDKIAADSTEVEDHDLVEKPKEVDEKGKGKEVAEDHDHVEKAKEVDDHVGKGKEVAEDLDNVEKAKEVDDDMEKGKGKKDIWDATDFMNKLDDLNTIFKVIMVADYLNFQSLRDLSCQTVADRIKDKQPEEIREIFHIENDFTKEEEEELRKENAWAFEDVPPRTATDDSETTEEGDSKTTEEGGSGTTKEGDSKTTEEGSSKTTEEGGSDTTKEGGSKTTDDILGDCTHLLL